MTHPVTATLDLDRITAWRRTRSVPSGRERAQIQWPAELDAAGRDLELSDGRRLLGPSGLEDGEGAFHLGAVLHVLEEDHVVGDVGHTEFAEPRDAEQFHRLVRQH